MHCLPRPICPKLWIIMVGTNFLSVLHHVHKSLLCGCSLEWLQYGNSQHIFYRELKKSSFRNHQMLTISGLLPNALLYPRHLCRGVYSFRLSVRMFVRSFVRSFVLPSVAWNLRQSFALKFLKWCISQQLLIRKHSYLDHSYPGGLAFTP